MRLVFLGSGEFGLPTLAALCRAHDVALVVTQPDRPAGRNRQLTPTPIALWTQETGIPLLKPEKVNDPAIVEQIRQVGADAHVVVAFGQKIGRQIIDAPRLGALATINLHASLLPLYRGAAPINWAMVRGEAVTGNTVFGLVEKMDAGDVLGMQSTPIDPMETAGELHDRLAELGPELVLRVLDDLAGGRAHPQKQDESQATLAPKLSKADAVIDFDQPAAAIRGRVHGLTPWPGVTVWYGTGGAETGQRQALMLRRVEAMPGGQGGTGGGGGAAGQMVRDGVLMTGGGMLRIVEVQPPGKRVMTWEEFQRGARLGVGTQFYGSAE
jgi:methionyl-tRNA formyltransferase